MHGADIHSPAQIANPGQGEPYTMPPGPVHCKKRGVTEHPRGAIFYCLTLWVTMETVKYCSPGVFSYTAFFTV